MGGAISIAAHVAVFTVLLWPHEPPARPKPLPDAIMVNVADKPLPPAPPAPEELKPASVQPAMPRFTVVTTEPSEIRASDNSDIMSESQLAGATGVGEGGGGGGGCDIGRLVQQALRRDPLVRTAVVNAGRVGKAILIWDGDWVRSGAQEGKGLSAVREAIMWEVGFAPQACRSQRMHGLVLLSLADGGTRFVVGTNEWRWSDLLGLRGVRSVR
ncbi:MAG TPA: hypothetical protein VGM72_09845 [Micropepsaceae bacterium]